MTFYFKWGNYGVHFFVWVYDIARDDGFRTGLTIWWRQKEPRIEETWIWSNGSRRPGGHARFTWELRKNGKPFDGFYVEGPLVKFGVGGE